MKSAVTLAWVSGFLAGAAVMYLGICAVAVIKGW